MSHADTALYSGGSRFKLFAMPGWSCHFHCPPAGAVFRMSAPYLGLPVRRRCGTAFLVWDDGWLWSGSRFSISSSRLSFIFLILRACSLAWVRRAVRPPRTVDHCSSLV